jgi:hypothetical protein
MAVTTKQRRRDWEATAIKAPSSFCSRSAFIVVIRLSTNNSHNQDHITVDFHAGLEKVSKCTVGQSKSQVNMGERKKSDLDERFS